MTDRRYQQRRWGLPVGILLGCLVNAAITAVLNGGEAMRAALKGDYFGRFWITETLEIFAVNLLPFALVAVFFWSWLEFMEYRGRVAFTLTGFIGVGGAAFFYYARDALFFSDAGWGPLLFLTGTKALTGALAMLILHLTTYRRVGAASV